MVAKKYFSDEEYGVKLVKTYGTTEYYECPSCEGEGIDVEEDGVAYKCPTCRGTGEIVEEGE
jgi:DnaJ-class molecular chaperone